MIWFAVNAVLCVAGWGLLLFFYGKIRRERSILIRQNMVYLIAFVNYFDWLANTYAPGVLADVMADKDYVQYMKKNGLPESVFSAIVENALQKSRAGLMNKTTEVMEAIKQPLSAEINALLED